MAIKSDTKCAKKSKDRVLADTSQSGRVFGYIRVSTIKQDVEGQRYGILQWADERKLTITEWVEETISSRKGYKDRLLGSLLETLRPGDTLIVSEISRLGRSLTEVMTILHTLMETGVRVYTCKERFELDDSINSKVLAFAFSLAAEIERQMISSRTREALSRLKSEGKTLGRPKGSLSGSKLDGREQEIQDMLAKGVSKASAARLLDVSRGTLYGWLESRGQGEADTDVPRNSGSASETSLSRQGRLSVRNPDGKKVSRYRHASSESEAMFVTADRMLNTSPRRALSNPINH